MLCNEQKSKIVLFTSLSVLAGITSFIMIVGVFILGFGPRDINEYQNQITVQGTGEVYAIPDIANISFTVKAEKDTVGDAEDEVSEKIGLIISDIKDLDIESKDIKTTSFNSNPRYEYRSNDKGFGNSTRVLRGYEVSQTLSIKVRDTDNAGKVLEIVGDRGVENISGPRFSIDDTDVYQQEARELAISDAKEKAEKIADGLGVKLKKIIGFSENGGDAPEPYYREMMSGSSESSMGSKSISVDLPSGENIITQTVSITYKIK
ncbi:MAG: hypothetical protein ACI9AR_000560 [Flavobacteriaceae bacterium]|jgi:uncharacterized protein YggE